ncbi:metalloprotease TldD [Gilliamella sp. wkB18]|uniref:metalloprotease TldD n=1 Tax=unclassified Gilliamella TaxID=2685620 RepID=UPI0004DCEC8F|nr:metalloprotease TldD [Gilliamella apicola]KFA59679.1 TldD protein, part of proposed TldE/TldD proteolytic complex [Gilliamella apicola]OCG53525.1 metalloprotease TldD [Gilliamella apicola]OCG64497.1 metalloprotease TldD [Gilliamella apicola]
MIVTQVSERLLNPNNLSQQDIFRLLDILSSRQIDYGDLYFLSGYYESWSLEDGIIKNATFHRDQGVGARAIIGEKTGFAYTDQLSLKRLEQSVLAANSITKLKTPMAITPLKTIDVTPIYQSLNPINSFSQEQKIALLRQIDQLARSIDSRVIEVSASLTGSYEDILIAGTDGTLCADIRPLVRLSISVIVEQDGIRERGNSGGGGRFSYDYFLMKNPKTAESYADSYTRDAVKQALISLSAIPAPAGSMPVILGAGWPGVLLHEAVGHGLEGDFNRKNSSVFSGKIGEKVTSELCTIVDDGTISNLRGSLTIDDEGTQSQKTVLIENGILKGYMFDKLNAKLMNTHSTGNGRREGYACLPMPRMTNTYMLHGNSSFDDIISSVEYGLYAPNFAGGQVDITSGKFVFSASEAYLIEKGKVTKPVKGATLIGSGIETMQQISMVGNDLELDPGIGVCGKAGQSIPVGVGQPTLKVDNLTVGGIIN